jgi:hypothetical protein
VTTCGRGCGVTAGRGNVNLFSVAFVREPVGQPSLMHATSSCAICVGYFVHEGEHFNIHLLWLLKLCDINCFVFILHGWLIRKAPVMTFVTIYKFHFTHRTLRDKLMKMFKECDVMEAC